MDFFDVLVRYEIGLWTAIERELARRGRVSLARLQALRVLGRRAGQARVQEVSEDIGITVGAASKLVDRLESDGLAVRRPNPGNRRSSLIALTPAGHEALSAGEADAGAALARAVGDEEIAPLTAALGRLQARLDDQIGVRV